MADLKTGTTVGGALVWTQGNFPLFPTGNTLLYKNFKIYSENDKPQAIDNDFVSKKDGGTYTGSVTIYNERGIRFDAPNRKNARGYITSGTGDGADQINYNLEISSHWGIGFKASYQDGLPVTIWMDTRNGNINSVGTIGATYLFSNNAPTSAGHVTRKDYVDNQINTVNNNANTKVSKSGDTMTGNLNVPTVVLANAASDNNQAPQLGQVVSKGVTLDYGTY